MNLTLLSDPPAGLETNMAKDRELLEGLKRGSGGPTLRFYSWSETCITIGFGLSLEKVMAKEFPFPVARRPTGGGLVIHEPQGEVTVAAALRRPGKGKSLTDLYRLVHEPLIWALRELGHPVELVTGCVTDPAKNAIPACFEDAPCLHDGVLGGKKVLGGGLRVAGQFFLYQGTIKLPSLSQEAVFQTLRSNADLERSLLQEEALYGRVCVG